MARTIKITVDASGNPKTGDDVNGILWLAVIAGLGCAVIYSRRRKRMSDIDGCLLTQIKFK